MNYKDGRTLKQHYCKCGKKIDVNVALYGSGKCRWCGKIGYKPSEVTKEKIRQSLKGRKRPDISKKMLGSGNHQFENKTNFCNECNKQLRNGKATHCHDCHVSLGLNRGVNASNYVHGLTEQPYPKEFNNKLRTKIRKRDDYICQICNMTEEEHLIVYGVKLSVHHADYDKENNQEENLFSTCISCHSRTNFNRNYWTEYFTNKIKKQGEITCQI